MISTADFRIGIVIKLENDLMELVDFQHVKPGKGGAFVRSKFKNVLTGRVLEKTFRSGEKFDEARIEEQRWQYLYNDGDLFHFMNNDTYEQIEVGTKVIGDASKWMKDNTDVNLVFFERKVINIKLPMHVELVVTKSDPGIQGDRSSGATKPATLETGVTVQVPLFIEEGDTLKVDTRTGQYVERVN